MTRTVKPEANNRNIVGKKGGEDTNRETHIEYIYKQKSFEITKV